MKKFFKFIFLIVFIGVLVGCSGNLKHINKGLTNLRGQHINSLINRIGYPDSQRMIAGRKLYTWGSSRLFAIDGNLVDLYCTITVEVNSNEKIVNWQYDGNNGGCRGFANGLKN